MKWPFAALLLASQMTACGGSDGPTNPGSPSPSISPSPQAGPVAGAYLLEIRPAGSCGVGGPLTFPMVAAAAGPGVQVLVVGDGRMLELELLSASSTLTGGFGTTEAGVLSNEAVRLWLHAIGSGPVTRGADGRGQVAAGRLAGYVAFGHAAGPEGSLGSCDSVEHTFVLRVR
jgi:predicted small lipoprotein YifL